MGWLIGIGLLQLVVLCYIAYQVETAVKQAWLREALQVLADAIRSNRVST